MKRLRSKPTEALVVRGTTTSGQKWEQSGKCWAKWQGLSSLKLLCGAILAMLLVPGSVAKAAPLRVACESVESTNFKDVQGLVVVSGQCPKTVNLSHRWIAGSLEFRDLQGLKTLDLTAAVIKGSLTMIGVTLETLLLRGIQVGGDVYIAERFGAYNWIDNQEKKSCQCEREYGHTRFKEIDADFLSARSFSMHGVGAEKFSMRYAKLSGLVTLSRADFGKSGNKVSFGHLRALGLDLNSAVFRGELQAYLLHLAGNLTLECSVVGERLILWGSRFGGQLHLEGTRFTDTAEVDGHLSEMQQLTLGAAEGSVDLFRLERSKVRILRLTDTKECLRGPRVNRLLTEGMEFEWLEGRLDDSFAGDFFAKGQQYDPTLYRRLADNYSARAHHDLADEALIYQNPWLGRIRWLGSSLFGLTLVMALWLAPVFLWTVRGWPAQAAVIDRVVLAADLLLPDLVALGARERYQEELREISGLGALLLGSYRLLGWLIISVMIYVIIERASY